MTRNIISPPFLEIGDKIKIVSPAGKIEKEVVFKAVETLTSLGYNVEIAENALSEYGRFSGTDRKSGV